MTAAERSGKVERSASPRTESEVNVTICCPKCASSEGRSVEALYTESKTPDKEQSSIGADLSRQTAPPERRHPAFWISLTILFTILSAITLKSLSQTAAALTACAILSGWMAHEAIEYNRADLPRLLDYWHHSIMCARCGQVFVPI